eukprot:TRINITY_DN13669_c1_g1_i1.p1 TRINITY_DN13669_c1_g1~~TRINITY_DN13669_c1_g1_i1.p1  ORF type:complete len:518 (-),score=71.23 TRINITY_DN13669_c1_g1_i1:257-1810(-)
MLAEVMMAINVLLMTVHAGSSSLRPRWSDVIAAADCIFGSRANEEAPEIQSEIKRRMDERRVNNMKIVNELTVLLLPISTIINYYAVAHAETFTFYTASQLAVYGTALLVKLDKHFQLTSRRVEMICALLNFIVLIRTASADQVWWTETSVGRAHNQLMIGLLNLNYRSSLLWNCCFWLVCGYKSMALEGKPWSTAFSSQWQQSASTWLIVFSFEILLARSVKTNLLQQMSEKQHSAVRKLLRAICDAQLQLGEDLTIKGDAKRFCQLMMFSPNFDVTGRRLTDFMCEDDRCRFERFMQEAVCNMTEDGSGDDPASILHVTFHDSLGIAFESELFHTAFQDHLGKICHVVGLSQEEGKHLQTHVAPKIADDEDAVHSELAAASQDASSSSHIASLDKQLAQHANGISALVNIYSVDFPIKELKFCFDESRSAVHLESFVEESSWAHLRASLLRAAIDASVRRTPDFKIEDLCLTDFTARADQVTLSIDTASEPDLFARRACWAYLDIGFVLQPSNNS